MGLGGAGRGGDLVRVRARVRIRARVRARVRARPRVRVRGMATECSKPIMTKLGLG